MKMSDRGKTVRLLGGGALIVIGIGLLVYTFAFPMVRTLVACPDSTTHWNLFGISLPTVRSISIDPIRMQLSWYNGCNTAWTSLWIPLGGVSSLALGLIVTVKTLRTGSRSV